MLVVAVKKGICDECPADRCWGHSGVWRIVAEESYDAEIQLCRRHLFQLREMLFDIENEASA